MVVLRARHTTIKVALASDVTVTTAAALDTFFGTSSTISNAKNVTVVIPEGAVDKIDEIGVDGNGYQNQELELKPFGIAQFTGTLVHDGDEVLEIYAYGAGTAVNATHHRYRLGDGNRPECAVLVNLTDGTNVVNAVLDNAYVNKLGDAKLSADGHWEQDFSITCLAKDTHIEYKD